MAVHENIEYSIVINGVSITTETAEKIEHHLDGEGIEEYRVYTDTVTVCKIDSKITALRLDSEINKIIQGD